MCFWLLLDRWGRYCHYCWLRGKGAILSAENGRLLDNLLPDRDIFFLFLCLWLLWNRNRNWLWYLNRNRGRRGLLGRRGRHCCCRVVRGFFR